MIGADLEQILDGRHVDALRDAISLFVDETVDDILEVRSGADPSHSRLAGWLPGVYRGRYDGMFLKKFLCCGDLVGWKLFSPDPQPLASVAEELALHILIEQAEGILQADAIEPDFSTLVDLAFEDLDFEWLYDASADGLQESEAFEHMRFANLAFDDWFKPFRPEDPVHPYVDEGR